MDPLLRKLQHRRDDPVVVLGAPESFLPTIDHWRAEGLDVRNRPRGGVPMWVVFVRRPDDVADRGPKVADAVRHVDDPVVWFAYPKRSSSLAHLDLHRDQGWDPLESAGYAPVRQVAIDADWSALRFRRAERTPPTAAPRPNSNR